MALKEAVLPEFKIYQQQVINNAKAMAKALQDRGYHIVSGEKYAFFRLANISGTCYFLYCKNQ